MSFAPRVLCRAWASRLVKVVVPVITKSTRDRHTQHPASSPGAVDVAKPPASSILHAPPSMMSPSASSGKAKIVDRLLIQAPALLCQSTLPHSSSSLPTISYCFFPPPTHTSFPAPSLSNATTSVASFEPTSLKQEQDSSSTSSISSLTLPLLTPQYLLLPSGSTTVFSTSVSSVHHSFS